jgi:hypothetical protein
VCSGWGREALIWWPCSGGRSSPLALIQTYISVPEWPHLGKGSWFVISDLTKANIMVIFRTSGSKTRQTHDCFIVKCQVTSYFHRKQSIVFPFFLRLLIDSQKSSQVYRDFLRIFFMCNHSSDQRRVIFKAGKITQDGSGASSALNKLWSTSSQGLAAVLSHRNKQVSGAYLQCAETFLEWASVPHNWKSSIDSLWR